MAQDIDRLERLLRRELDGTHPLVVIETDDESSLRDALYGAIDDKVPYRRWSAVHGLSSARVQDRPIENTEPAAGALAWLPIHATFERCVTVFYDLTPHLADARTLRALKEALNWARGTFSVIVLVESHANIPPAIAGEAHRIEIPPPAEDELEQLVRDTVKSISKSRQIEASMRRSTLEAIGRTLRGLTRRQAERVVTTAVTEDDRFNDDDLERVMLHKRNACADLEGVLEFVQAPVSMDQIGGLARLKTWLDARQLTAADEAAQYGLSLPRGVMLLGVQGAGKSLAAKAVATAWKVPLLRLDAGALYDKFVGESERKLRDSLEQADRMAPAVLWIDEIEKGFASASSMSNDGGLSRRMFGTLLTWMQERRSATFMVATANDISALPPELLRKGRFDEIFFVDLPGPEVRRTILSIHLAKRKQRPETFDLARVTGATEAFSGAEIEAGIESAMRTAFADGRRPATTEDLLEAYRASPPISVVMADRVQELRDWSVGRCVPAD
ncbi:MAG: ATP-dependent zinc metalloprotease FtsH 3 [Planctomycetota bacterium]